MRIISRSTMRINEEDNSRTYHLRGQNDIRKYLRDVTADRSTALYRNSCGFPAGCTPEDYERAMMSDQELYRKNSGLLCRVKDIAIEKNELNPGREMEELIQIADSMAAFFAAEGFPSVYDVWFKGADKYYITYVLSAVSPVDGRKYTWNKTSKQEREQMALDTIAYKVTGKNRPDNEFNFLVQDNH